MAIRRCFQTTLPEQFGHPSYKARTLVVSECREGRWAAVFSDPAKGPERGLDNSEPAAESVDASKRLAIRGAMEDRSESFRLNADAIDNQIEKYFQSLQWKVCPDRPRFLRRHGALRLRVEQIGPHLWGYGATRRQVGPDKTVEQLPMMDAELTKEAAERRVLEWAERAVPPQGDTDKEWHCCSSASEESWATEIKDLDFPGYPERKDDMKRWIGS
jgi:hypothetical protein